MQGPCKVLLILFSLSSFQIRASYCSLGLPGTSELFLPQPFECGDASCIPTTIAWVIFTSLPSSHPSFLLPVLPSFLTR